MAQFRNIFPFYSLSLTKLFRELCGYAYEYDGDLRLNLSRRDLTVRVAQFQNIFPFYSNKIIQRVMPMGDLRLNLVLTFLYGHIGEAFLQHPKFSISCF